MPSSPLWLVRTAAAVALVASISTPAEPAPYAPHVPGEILVKYKPSVTASRHVAIENRIEAHVVDDHAWIGVRQIRLPERASLDEAIRQLQADPDVVYAEPNYIVHASVVPNDSLLPALYAMRGNRVTGSIGATEAWDVSTGDPELKIGVIDTGIDYDHPDLVENIWSNEAEANGVQGYDDDGNGYVDDVHGYDFVNDDGDPFDDADISHGTHCAGTIAARGDNRIGVVGVMWRAKLVAIKFLDLVGSGTTADAIRSVEYAHRVGVRLTSNSWGGAGFSQALLDAIEAAGASAGQLFVAAAGNQRQNSDDFPHYPASYRSPYVLSVAASDPSDSLASFSNRGYHTVQLAAPGFQILSTLRGATYGLLSGTSMAAPHVAGGAGLVWSQFPWLSPTEVRQHLMQTVDVVPRLALTSATNGRLNVYRGLRGVDTEPPDRVTDLHVAASGSDVVTLTWTRPGDPGGTGVQAYDLRYATSPIDEASFASATPVPTPPPAAAGTLETVEVQRLATSTTYWFALRASDRFRNTAPISNAVMATTLPPPDLAPLVAGLSGRVHSGGVHEVPLTLENRAAGRLDFTVLPEATTASAPTKIHPFVPIAKGEDGLGVGSVAPDRAGGPDAFGYRWSDSDAPGGPEFAWVDATSSGAPLDLQGDDAVSAPVPLGFSFPFYGSRYEAVRVSTNGFVTFEGTEAPFANQALPNAGGVAAMIAAFWEDLDFRGDRRVHAVRVGDRFVVTWSDVQRLQGGGPFTFQILLEKSGEIRFQYLTMGASTHSATVGMQDGSKTRGLTVVHNAPYVRDGLAVRIRRSSWLSATPTQGRIPPFGSTEVRVRLDAQGITEGEIEGRLSIATNDPDVPLAHVPLRLTIDPAPNVSLSPEMVEFGATFVGRSVRETVRLTNDGAHRLDVSEITVVGEGFEVDPATFSLDPGASRTLEARFVCLREGAFDGALRVVSNDPDEPEITVALRANGIRPPYAVVQPDSLARTLVLGQVATDTVRFENRGGSSLDWELSVSYALVGEDPTWTATSATALPAEGKPRAASPSAASPAWLTPLVESGSIPAGGRDVLPVRFSTLGLPPGDVEALLVFRTNDPDRPVIKRPVRLRIVTFAVLAATNALEFGAVRVRRSKSLAVEIRSIGTAPLRIQAVATIGPYAAAFGPPLPFTIPVRSSTTLNVAFAPLDTCTVCIGEVVIDSNDPNGPHRIRLSGTAIGIPRIEVGTDTIHVALAPTLGTPYTSTSRTINVSNTGQGPLELFVRAVDHGRSGPATDAPTPVVDLDAARGPDAFGYFSFDSDFGGPEFAWVDPAVGETLPLRGDEGIEIGVPLGFEFPFYGRRFDRVNVSVNGWLSFTHTSMTAFHNVPLPDARSLAPENLIAAFWDDLMVHRGAIRVRRDPDRFVVSWVDVMREPPDHVHPSEPLGPPTGPYTFQVVLHRDGRVLVQHLTAHGITHSATLGIQNATKDVGLTVVNDGVYVHDTLAVLFEPGPEPKWLKTSPRTLEVANGMATIGLALSAQGMPDGDHRGALRLHTNEPGRPVVDVPIVMHVGVEESALELGFEHVPGALGDHVRARVRLDACNPAAITSSSVKIRGIGVAPEAPVHVDGCEATLGFPRRRLLATVGSGSAVPVEILGKLGEHSWFRGRTTVRMLRPMFATLPSVVPEGAVVDIAWTDAAGSPPSIYELWYSDGTGARWSPLVVGSSERHVSWSLPPGLTGTVGIEVVARSAEDGSFVGAALAPMIRIEPASYAHTAMLLDSHGEAVIDARVRWLGPGGQSTEGRTDREGRVRLRVPRDAEEVVLSSGGSGPSLPARWELRGPLTLTEDDTEATWRLPHAVRIDVQVLAPDGSPARGAIVFCEGGQQVADAELGPRLVVEGWSGGDSVTTGEEGIAALRLFPTPRIRRLNALLPGARPGTWMRGWLVDVPALESGSVVLQLDAPVPTLLERFTAHRGDEGITLEWSLTQDAAASAVLERRGIADAAWTVIGTFGLEGGRTFRHLDRDARRGTAYVYRVSLRGPDLGAPHVMGEVSVAGGAVCGEAPCLRVSSRGDGRVEIDLAAEPGDALSILDVQGRVVSRPAGARLDAGERRLSWSLSAEGTRRGPGVYFVRLSGRYGAIIRRVVLFE